MPPSLPSWRDLAAQQVPPVSAIDLHWQRRWLGYPRYWRWQLGGWCLLVLSQLSMVLIIPRSQRVSLEVFMMCSMFAAGIVFTHLLRVVMIGLRGQALTWGGLLMRLLPWMFLFSALWGSGLAKLGSELLGDHFIVGPRSAVTDVLPASQRFVITAFGIGNASFLVQCVWIAGYFLHHLFSAYQHSQMERLRLEASHREAEVRHLRSQMDPHFLFNSLNTVRALISLENTEARSALTHLSELLRNSLRQSDKAFIPLSEELAALESHLAIEQLRFGTRLRVRQRIGAGLGSQLVPPFLIQTLVENAIKHGVSKREVGGVVSLTLGLRDQQFFCFVRNSGALGSASAEGVGLRNTRTRLLHLYHGKAFFDLAQLPIGQVRAVVSLPPLVSPLFASA